MRRGAAEEEKLKRWIYYQATDRSLISFTPAPPSCVNYDLYNVRKEQTRWKNVFFFFYVYMCYVLRWRMTGVVVARLGLQLLVSFVKSFLRLRHTSTTTTTSPWRKCWITNTVHVFIFYIQIHHQLSIRERVRRYTTYIRVWCGVLETLNWDLVRCRERTKSSKKKKENLFFFLEGDSRRDEYSSAHTHTHS